MLQARTGNRVKQQQEFIKPEAHLLAEPSMYTRLVVWHCNEGKGFLSESTVKIRHLNGSLIHCATRSFSSLWSEFYGITKPSCLLQAAVRAEIDKIGARPAGNVTQLPLIGEKT